MFNGSVGHVWSGCSHHYGRIFLCNHRVCVLFFCGNTHVGENTDQFLSCSYTPVNDELHKIIIKKKLEKDYN